MRLVGFLRPHAKDELIRTMHDDGFFDDVVARTYDQDQGRTDPELVRVTTKTLSRLACDGQILEFAIGTGRIALPLIELGHKVKGIDLSRAMVAELRKKAKGRDVEVAIGDMTSTTVSGSFSLVFLVFNTIDNLTSQDAQIACFENAAAHLEPGGRFVIETQVPPIQRIPLGETKLAFDRSSAHWGIDEYDVVTQRYTSSHIWIEDGSSKQVSIPFRYAWPAELDLMAKFAGLALEHRWGDWEQAPFISLSQRHISVWRKPGG
jgi:SAM-dependent methyltransferase